MGIRCLHGNLLMNVFRAECIARMKRQKPFAIPFEENRLVSCALACRNRPAASGTRLNFYYIEKNASRRNFLSRKMPDSAPIAASSLGGGNLQRGKTAINESRYAVPGSTATTMT